MNTFGLSPGEFYKQTFLAVLESARGGCLSKTRKNIEHVANAAGQSRTLDTNIYVRPTPTASDLSAEDKFTDIFDFLMDNIEPEVDF